MQLYLLRWLTRPSGLWTLSEEEFGEEIVNKALGLAQDYSLIVGMFDLEEDLLQILLFGAQDSVSRFLLRLESQIEEILSALRPAHPNKAFSEFYCVSRIHCGE